MRKIAIICITYVSLQAAPGCIDNSYHLKQRCDSKNYHYVTCNCPCEKQYKILADRGQCSKCKHYRDPKYSKIMIERGEINCSQKYINSCCKKLKRFINKR